MPLLDGDEDAVAGVANFPAGDQFRFDSGAILGRFDDPGLQRDRASDRCRAEKLDVKLGGYRAWNSIIASLLHQVMCSRPIRVAIEQCSDDAAVQHPRECLVMRLGVKLCDILIAVNKASDPQSLLIGRSAAEANALG